MWNARLGDSQAGINIARSNINLRHADDIILMVGKEEKLNSLLMRVKQSIKAGLKLNIQKTKIITFGLIILWEIEGGKVEAVIDFLFLGSKITADSDCSHEIRRCLLHGRKAMTILNSILKSRDITLPTKIHIVKATVSSVVMYRCESWIIRKGWVPKNWCFQIAVLEKTLESFGQQGDQTSQSERKSTLHIHWKDWC